MSAPIAVIAKSNKQLGGGLGEFREVLRHAGVPEPLWLEFAKGKQAPGCAKEALAAGAELIFVWGGDGTVQRCIDVVAGTSTPIAILPAGTGNLLARNLGIPQDIERAVQIGLHGTRRRIDVGTANGEHFAIMAGAGLDALMIRDAERHLKDRFGRAAYLWTGARHLDAEPVMATVELDGRTFYEGDVTCVLVGNMSNLGNGVEVFDGSHDDDGVLECGVVSARSRVQWLRTISRVVLGRAEKSPFVAVGRGSSVRVRFDRRTDYELDGGARTPTKKFTVKVEPKSLLVCVPRYQPSGAADA